ncbi:MAG: hypothetical protein U5L02_10265 [Rheinheimera sp.]|nr:hypothetical protein [Rheinheimera sp.]
MALSTQLRCGFAALNIEPSLNKLCPISAHSGVGLQACSSPLFRHQRPEALRQFDTALFSITLPYSGSCMQYFQHVWVDMMHRHFAPVTPRYGKLSPLISDAYSFLTD